MRVMALDAKRFFADAVGTADLRTFKRLTAFLLSFFLGGVGAGRFCVGSDALAGAKLALFVVCICCPCVLVLCGMGGVLSGMVGGDSRSSGLGIDSVGVVGCMSCVCLCCVSMAVSLWWLADVIMFGINEIPDGNGVLLAPW